MKVPIRPSLALLFTAALLAFSAHAQVALFAEGAVMPPPADAAQQRAKAKAQVQQGEVQAAEQDRLHQQAPSALNTSQEPSVVPPPTLPPEEHAPVADEKLTANLPPSQAAKAQSAARKSPPRASPRKLPAHPVVPAHAAAPTDPRAPAKPTRADLKSPDPDR